MWYYLLTFSRISISLVFFASVFGKLRSFSAFQQTIDQLHILPGKSGKPVAYLLLASEAITIPLLWWSATLGFALAIGLLGLFGLVLWIAVGKGNPISCGCFGPSQKPISGFDIWRNIGLIFVALLGIVSLAMTPNAQMQPWIAEYILTSAISIVLTILWINFGVLAEFLEWAGNLNP